MKLTHEGSRAAADELTVRQQAGRVFGITAALVTVLTGGLPIHWCVALLQELLR